MINTVSRGLNQAEVINPVFTYSDQVKHPGNCSSGGVLISSADQPVVIETSGKRSTGKESEKVISAQGQNSARKCLI